MEEEHLNMLGSLENGQHMRDIHTMMKAWEEPEQAQKMPFWNYYHNKEEKENIRWGTSVFRYISDDVAAKILKDITKIKVGTRDEQLANEFFESTGL